MALLDSGCTKTVCGEVWLQYFLDSLCNEEYLKVVVSESKNMFKFGDNKMIKSLKLVKFPVIIAGVPATITTDVVKYDIPLLLSKEAMKKANTKIDFKQDKVIIFGKEINIKFTSTGHYCIKLDNYFSEENYVKSNIVLFCKSITKSSSLEKQKIALKLHRQFSHPNSSRLINLLNDCEIVDEELISFIKELDTKCEICLKYKKSKPRPIVGFPLAKSFNETIAMDLKEWSNNKKIWFLHIIDHATRYSVSSVIRSKKKEVIVKKIFQCWIGSFGYPNKILVDNGGEFANDEFITFCENLNIRICTTAAESPWSNGLVERHNAVLGLTVAKTIEDTKCDLDIAVAWAVSAKNSLKNVNGFSPNQLVFGKNPNYPNTFDDFLPALENKTSSQIVAENLNALHSARENFIKNEASSKLKLALKHQTRTSGDVVYNTGDIVFYKRKDIPTWKGPGTVIGQDGQQVLIKHGSTYVRVHPCNIQLKNISHINNSNIHNTFENENNLFEINHDDSVVSKSNKYDSPISFENLGPQEMNDEANNSSKIDENFENINMLLEAENDFSQQNNNDGINCVNIANENDEQKQNDHVSESQMFNNRKHPKIKDYVEYKLFDSDEVSKSQILSRAGKVSGKYSNWFNIRDIENDTIASIDWQNVEKWKPISSEEVLISSHKDLSNFDFSTAKLEELQKWKSHNAYEIVDNENQEFITLRWVNTEKYINGKLKLKSRLVARGFQEDTSNILSDSPTCSKESLRLILNIIATFNWKCQSIDIKSAFLQNKSIDREIYVKPPKEANVPRDKLWKLNTTIYGLSDASRSWYINVKNELINLGTKLCQSDPAVFSWHFNAKLSGILCTHVDDFLFGGNEHFINNVIKPLKSTFTIGSEFCTAFKYLGLNINQLDKEIVLNQNDYIKSIDFIDIDNHKMKKKDDSLTESELEDLRSLVGQLGWVAGQTRPDLSFEVCQLSSCFNHATVNDVLKANKLLKKAKQENISLSFGVPGKLDKLKFVCFNDASLGNLKDGGSQGGYVIYLVGENETSSPIMWQSKKLRRIVKSAMAAETLVQVEAAESCYWLANLLNEIIYPVSTKDTLVKIECKTDNHQLYDAVHSIRPIQDKRLRIEIELLRQMLNRKELYSIEWIDKNNQLADSLTKFGSSSEKLLKTFITKQLYSLE